MDAGTQNRQWPRWQWGLLLAGLTALTLCTHGYHPLAEDGGLYVAGVEWTLDPSLFPHDTAFVTEHLRFSVFAPAMAAAARGTHLPLDWLLLLTYLASIGLTLLAARQILRRCAMSERAQLGGVALLAAWWTMPVAGTSLMLMDPYVTARSFSTPFSLLALAWAMDRWRGTRSALWCVAALLAAAAFHPLMAVYAAGLVVVLRLGQLRRARLAWVCLGAGVVGCAAAIQWLAVPESAAAVAAAYSRYYWFLSQWHWFEWIGLVGPLVILAAISPWKRACISDAAKTLIAAAAMLCVMAVVVTLAFAHESYRAHAVARLQPLRVYLLVYALMAMLVGAAVVNFCDYAHRWRRSVPALLVLVSAVGMFAVQRLEYPASHHLELPWRSHGNPWTQAFLWARENTPKDALFALDANYITTAGEDAQSFRATGQRSVLPDFSKDGGEAAITTGLAKRWQEGSTLQKNLSALSDRERDSRLLPQHVTWMVLHSDAVTVHPCAYRNDVVKVCTLEAASRVQR